MTWWRWAWRQDLSRHEVVEETRKALYVQLALLSACAMLLVALWRGVDAETANAALFGFALIGLAVAGTALKLWLATRRAREIA